MTAHLRRRAGRPGPSPASDSPGLELYNWGTFHEQVWSLEPERRERAAHRRHRLGQVDARRRGHHAAAAGAPHRLQQGCRRRRPASARCSSYVLGHYKSERNEATGTSRPVGAALTATYSVILGVFVNAGLRRDRHPGPGVPAREDAAGQPDRFFVVADSDAVHRRGLRRLRLRPDRPAHVGCARSARGPRHVPASTARSCAAGSASTPSRRSSCSTRRCR